MNKQELIKKTEKAFKMAESIMNDAGHFVPMLEIEIVDDKDEIQNIGVVLDIDDKENLRMNIQGTGLVMAVCKILGKIKDVRCIVMMNEAWASEVPKDTDLKTVGAPSQDPNKKEMLIVAGLLPDGTATMAYKEITSNTIKGKRYFTLSNLKMESENIEAELMSVFYRAYNHVQKNEIAKVFVEALGKKFEKNNLTTFTEIFQDGMRVFAKSTGGIANIIK